MMKKSEPAYYNFADDKKDYPDAWLYVIYSGRGPGKTYSTLLDCIKNKIPFAYLKRTQEDIDLITRAEFSPFKPINRDQGTDIIAAAIGKGFNKFIRESDEKKTAIGYALALSAIHKYKGFDLSEVDELIFDEFIPQRGERVNKKEGELLLDLYLTISRDRMHRKRPELKMILLANSTQLACPALNTLGLVDTIAEMENSGSAIYYDDDRKIFIRHVDWTPSVDENMGIIKTMSGSRWADVSLSGDFAFSDFSAVQRRSLKGHFPVCGFCYNNVTWYVWKDKRTGDYYCCSTTGSGIRDFYNLDKETQAKAFHLKYGILLRSRILEGRMFFEKYQAYDLIFNFTKHFDV